MTLSPKLGVVEISTLWHVRFPLPIQMFMKAASSPGLSGIGMPSPILWSHLLKVQRIVLLSSLLWWELGTNSLITGPGEWLSFRRFTSKLSWSWSWRKTTYRATLSGNVHRKRSHEVTPFQSPFKSPFRSPFSLISPARKKIKSGNDQWWYVRTHAKSTNGTH